MQMKNSGNKLLLCVCLLVGVMGSSVLAENLGLAQIAASSGSAAVVEPITNAVANIYSSTDNQDSIKAQITAIINEAGDTGDGEVVRSAVNAALDATPTDNLELTIAAINSSTAFTNFSAIIESVVASATGGLSSGGDDQGEDNDDQGDDNPMDDDDNADIDDDDIPATQV
jgi:hypothetical protein